MVLALGVIIVEGFDAVDLHRSFGKEDDSFCEKAIQEQNNVYVGLCHTQRSISLVFYVGVHS